MGNAVKFFCYFGIGMLLTDLYANKEKFIYSSDWCFAIGVVSLIVIVFVPTLTSYAGYWLKFFFTTLFFYTVLTNQRMKQFFSNKYLAIIGGDVLLYLPPSFWSTFCFGLHTKKQRPVINQRLFYTTLFSFIHFLHPGYFSHLFYTR